MQTSVLTWVIGSFIVVINTYFLITSFVKLLLHSGLSTVSQVFSGIFGFLGMLIYIVAILYLAGGTGSPPSHCWRAMLSLQCPVAVQVLEQNALWAICPERTSPACNFRSSVQLLI
jgi:uncharacterized membrane protein required for colicin V production